MPLLGSEGGVLPGLRLDLSIQRKKSGVLVNSVGEGWVSSSVHKGEVGENVYVRSCWKSHIRNLHLLVFLRAVCYPRELPA